MNTKRLLLLSALCMTMGATQVSAQSFLKKIKDRGTKIVKKVAPKPVRDVVNSIDDVSKAAKDNTNANKRSNRTANQGSSTTSNRRSSSRERTDFEPAHKMLTIKLYKGLGIKTWLGRKAFNTPQPPTQCSKQSEWFRAIPDVIELDNASLMAEIKMINKWVEGNKSSCEPVFVRREALNSEMGARARALDNAVNYLNNANSLNEDDYTPAEPLEEDAFKRAMQSDYSPLYPLLED